MAQNTNPIFSLIPVVSFGTITGNVGLTRSDGVGTIGTDIFKIFTADATDGSYVSKVRITAAATTSTAMTASVIRFYISSITSGSTTAADTVLYAEISTAAITASHTTSATNYYEVAFNVPLPASYTILVSIDDNLAANTRWQFLTFAGDYS
jgi:hypothetical protein